MEFSEFANRLGNVIRGSSNTKIFTRTLFEVILPEEYKSLLDARKKDSYKGFYNGNSKINKFAAEILIYAKPKYFAEFIENYDDEICQKLCNAFKNEFPDATKYNIGEKLAGLFDEILTEAAAQEKSSTQKSTTITPKAKAEKETKALPQDFDNYLTGAKNRYEWTKLTGQNERPLYDVFVCSNIGLTTAFFPYRPRGTQLKDATLESIRSIDRRRDSKHALIVGPCGYGKTVMLQHLFLEAARQRYDTGLIPIFAELRHFSPQSMSLTTYLKNIIEEYEPSFKEEKLLSLLKEGRAQILLDGLDEMNTEETNYFQRRLRELIHAYPDNQIVITSRDCPATKGIREFTKLFLQPLNEEQSEELFEKLLHDNKDETAKDIILSLFDSKTGYIRYNGFIATNPMLLTIIIKQYKKFTASNGSQSKFYETLYKAIIKEHDEDKEAFGRFFHCVSDADEFTTIFREFCAITYIDGVSEFDERTFEKYFKKLEKKKELNNPNICRLEAFQYDVCSTACMMYEQNSNKYYIDPGFQDFFFSEYFYFENSGSTKDMAKKLIRRDPDSFRNTDALKMLYEMDKEKTEICIILPFLERIFKGKSKEDAFLHYLEHFYGTIKYIEVDQSLVNQYMQLWGAKTIEPPMTVTHPKNIIAILILELLKQQDKLAYTLFLDSIKRKENATHLYTAWPVNTFPYDPDKAREAPTSFLRFEKYDISTLDDPDYYDDDLPSPGHLRDENLNVVCFAYEYNVNPLQLKGNPEQSQFLFDIFYGAGQGKVFEMISDYYGQISKKKILNDSQ